MPWRMGVLGDTADTFPSENSDLLRKLELSALPPGSLELSGWRCGLCFACLTPQTLVGPLLCHPSAGPGTWRGRSRWAVQLVG